VKALEREREREREISEMIKYLVFTLASSLFRDEIKRF
jgi:hypothetical protein